MPWFGSVRFNRLKTEPQERSVRKIHVFSFFFLQGSIVNEFRSVARSVFSRMGMVITIFESSNQYVCPDGSCFRNSHFKFLRSSPEAILEVMPPQHTIDAILQ